ncbi:MAG TPA: hypothetical protein VL832_08555 [Puia sp.]|nr:hypothetical protein [Puia sp.]
MRVLSLAFAALFTLAQTTLAQNKAEILTNANVITMTKAGLGNMIIISKIESSTCKFDLSTNGLIDLKKQGVGDDVVKSMMDKSSGKPAVAKSDAVAVGAKNDVPKPAGLAGLSGVDLINHVYTYNKTTQAVKPLEKAVAGTRTKQGFFGGSILLQVDGLHSSLRLSLEDAGSFVINTSGTSSPEVVLYRLKSVKDHREVPSMKVGSFTGVKTGEDVISVDIIKLKEGIYQITPGKKLDKGEYFFTGKPVAGASSMDAYAFGVD